jgi:hypothetical protein
MCHNVEINDPEQHAIAIFRVTAQQTRRQQVLETMVPTYKNTRCHDAEFHNLNSHCNKNTKMWKFIS